MEFEIFGGKQLTVMNWWLDPNLKNYRGIICDGAIRSGKTVSMRIGFLLWSMTNFDNREFCLAGYTIESAYKNYVDDLIEFARQRGYKIRHNQNKNYIDIIGKNKNRYYVINAENERSYKKIQGDTFAGVLFDEVAIMPETFVNMALSRCSVPNAKVWYNCNPDMPQHWFKEKFIDQATQKKLIYMHFKIDDNLSLTEETKEMYKEMFTGVFKKRFIDGLWCVADGAIYPQLIDMKDVLFLTDEQIKKKVKVRYNLGLDFGKSSENKRGQHALVQVAITDKNEVIVLNCSCIKPNGVDFLFEWVQEKTRVWQEEYRITRGYGDSAEPDLILSIRRKIKLPLYSCIKMPIIERIKLVDYLISRKKLLFAEGTEELYQALCNSTWKDNKPHDKDERTDDGSYNNDIIDSFEYAIESEFTKLMRL